jgi:hypothetical protein
MFDIIKSGLMGVAWLGAAGVLLCSTLQVIRLLRRSNRLD